MKNVGRNTVLILPFLNKAPVFAKSFSLWPNDISDIQSTWKSEAMYYKIRQTVVTMVYIVGLALSHKFFLTMSHEIADLAKSLEAFIHTLKGNKA